MRNTCGIYYNINYYETILQIKHVNSNPQCSNDVDRLKALHMLQAWQTLWEEGLGIIKFRTTKTNLLLEVLQWQLLDF